MSKNECVLIDTGYDGDQVKAILSLINDKHLKLIHLITTHPHDDHRGQLFNYLHLDPPPLCLDYANTYHDQAFTVGDLSYRVLHTPGHSYTAGPAPEPASLPNLDPNPKPNTLVATDISIWIEDLKVLVCGDVLLTSLPPMLCYGANPNDLIETLYDLKALEANVIITGHCPILSPSYTLAMNEHYIKSVLDYLVMHPAKDHDLMLEQAVLDPHYYGHEAAYDLHHQNMVELEPYADQLRSQTTPVISY